MPNAYETTKTSFVTEILNKPNSFSFKSSGSKLHPTPQIGKGDYLLPGAYEFEDISNRFYTIIQALTSL